MGFDAHRIKEWAEAALASFTALRAAIGLLPSGPSKDEALRLLERAESEFKRAEAGAAQDLGFSICKRCWPPEIMLIRDDEQLRCRRCERTHPPVRTRGGGGSY